jgi:hypothetical protein
MTEVEETEDAGNPANRVALKFAPASEVNPGPKNIDVVA